MGTFKRFVETVEGPALRLFAATSKLTFVYDPNRHSQPEADDALISRASGEC
jgi:hypothetical protein